MQTLTFARALNDAIERLRLRAMLDLLGPIFNSSMNVAIQDQDKAKFSDLAFNLRAEYDRLGGDANEILGLLGLNSAMSSTSMGILLAAFQAAPNTNTVAHDERFRWLYHSLLAAIRLMEAVNKLLVEPKLRGLPEQDKILPLVVTDYDGHGVSLGRLQTILKELSALFEVLAHALGTDQQAARIQYVDSGTTITIGVEGVGEVIDALANLFGKAWRALRYRELDNFDRRIVSANTSLDFIAGLKARVDSGSIDQETAVKLEHAAKRHLDHLLGAGVMTEVVEEPNLPDREAIMLGIRDTKLLGSGEGSLKDDLGRDENGEAGR